MGCEHAQAAGGQTSPSQFEENTLSEVKRVIAVLSGKGGVGKSFVTGAIATELARHGHKVGVLDADITGPSIPKMFGMSGRHVHALGNLMLPEISEHGVKVMSSNLLLQNETDPVLWRGPVIAGAIRQFWSETSWGPIDYLLVDMPPGTGDVALTVFQSLPVDGIVIVTSPQDLVSMIVAKAVNMAEKMNVPSRYLRELAGGTSWKRALAARILNEHSSWSDRSRVLVRAVGDEVRGILSDSYRRLDSQRILSAFLGKALEQGAVAYDALWTDTKIYVETILPQPICIPTEFNGEVQIYMGARFSTSDFGDGAVDIRVFLLNGVCLNGMVRENVMKQIHLGGKLPDNIQLSQRTYELDTQTTVSAVNDLTAQLFGRDNIRRKALEIKAAAAKEVNFTQELERLMQKGRLLKTENEGVRKLLMNNNPDDGLAGGPTLWKLTQAITAYARETQPARQRELHELSGELLNRVNN